MTRPTRWRPPSRPVPSSRERAVAIAAVLNLVGAFLSTEVAKTISGGLIREGDGGVQITPTMILAGLIGAIVWNLVTWLLGLPSSSSHALFGGLIGAAIVGAWSFGPIDGAVLVSKVLIPAVLAPLLAGTGRVPGDQDRVRRSPRSASATGSRSGRSSPVRWSRSRTAPTTRRRRWASSRSTLIAAGMQPVDTGPQFWVIVACAIAIAAGTYSGGWRIIKTLGKDITEGIEPAAGFRRRGLDDGDDPRLDATSASRSRRPRSHPARSSAPASAARARRCAGGPPAASRSAGSSRSRPPGVVGRRSPRCIAAAFGWGVILDVVLAVRRDPHDLPGVASQRKIDVRTTSISRSRPVRASEAQEEERSRDDDRLDGVRHRRRRGPRRRRACSSRCSRSPCGSGDGEAPWRRLGRGRALRGVRVRRAVRDFPDRARRCTRPFGL